MQLRSALLVMGQVQTTHMAKLWIRKKKKISSHSFDKHVMNNADKCIGSYLQIAGCFRLHFNWIIWSSAKVSVCGWWYSLINHNKHNTIRAKVTDYKSPWEQSMLWYYSFTNRACQSAHTFYFLYSFPTMRLRAPNENVTKYADACLSYCTTHQLI